MRRNSPPATKISPRDRLCECDGVCARISETLRFRSAPEEVSCRHTILLANGGLGVRIYIRMVRFDVSILSGTLFRDVTMILSPSS